MESMGIRVVRFRPILTFARRDTLLNSQIRFRSFFSSSTCVGFFLTFRLCPERTNALFKFVVSFRCIFCFAWPLFYTKEVENGGGGGREREEDRERKVSNEKSSKLQ